MYNSRNVASQCCIRVHECPSTLRASLPKVGHESRPAQRQRTRIPCFPLLLFITLCLYFIIQTHFCFQRYYILQFKTRKVTRPCVRFEIPVVCTHVNRGDASAIHQSGFTSRGGTTTAVFIDGASDPLITRAHSCRKPPSILLYH